jgi:oxygen-independent coproporphyrinogen-3 oxidase
MLSLGFIVNPVSPIAIDGLYIHIPFCSRICSYCDFVKFLPQASNLESYASQVLREWDMLKPSMDVSRLQTLYIGGGTPSIDHGRILEHLVGNIGRQLPMSQLKEFTVEVNAETLCHDLLTRLLSLGVSRLSFGIQSSFSAALVNLGRTYPRIPLSRLDLVFSHPFHVNLDLIFGVPGIPSKVLDSTLSDYLKLPIHHLSAYELTLTPHHANFPFLPDEETVIAQTQRIRQRCEEQGFLAYEVSNFAKTGFASIHNQLYWEFGNVLGLGVSAHSSLSTHLSRQTVWTNPSSLKTYETLLGKRIHPLLQKHPLSRMETEKNYLMASLRRRSGLPLDDYRRRFGKDFVEVFGRSLQELKTWEVIRWDGKAVSASESGFLVLNQIVRKLFQDLDSGVLETH